MAITVKQLIANLQRFNPDADVYVDGNIPRLVIEEGEWMTILCDPNGKIIDEGDDYFFVYPHGNGAYCSLQGNDRC